jgi:hypothetical protein
MPIKSSRFLMLAIGLFSAAFALWNAGCAKIADPQPPEIRIPKPATDLAACQVSDFILLSVSKPAQNTNGTPVSTLRSVDVYRLATDKSSIMNEPSSDSEFLKQASRIQSIPSTNFESYLHGNTFSIQDRIPLPPGATIYTHVFRYAVLFVNNKNQAAGLSNRVRIDPIPIPQHPEGLIARVAENSIQLQWNIPIKNMNGSTPARIAGYAIYRSETKDSVPSAPINSDPLQKAEYEDRNFEFDKTYYYAVRTIGSLQNPRAESLPSETLEVLVRDTFPPSPPRDFNPVLENGTIVLLWAPSLSSDVAGYRIYRQEKGATSRLLLQNELVSSWSFRDNQVAHGKVYEYSVFAVDSHGNESEAVKAEAEIP